MVDRQPFGGFRLRGGGMKAGGPGYLGNLAHPRVVCENTMRGGLVISGVRTCAAVDYGC